MKTFHDGKITLHAGDCLAVLKAMPENSIDAVVTDPPYMLNFMGRAWDRVSSSIPIDPGFAHWFAGFSDGESCFSVHKKNVNGCQTYDCQFTITLRADDKPILLEIQKQLGGIGSLADRPKGEKGEAQARFCVSSKKDCQRLQAVFQAFPLRAKKAKDFEIWSQALDAWIAHEPGSSWEDVAYFREALMAVRKFGSVYRPEQLFFYQWAREVLRVLKPGGHMVAFSGTRTYHRMVCAIEDAGFEIRDQPAWVFGSGFPKSHDVSKGIDRELGAEREVIGRGVSGANSLMGGLSGMTGEQGHDITAPSTDAARQWQGYGTALKPSWEPICLARKPLSESTVAANVLRWGTGALNIDGCRIGAESTRRNNQAEMGYHGGNLSASYQTGSDSGRWPANLCHDGSPEVLAGFPDAAGASSNGRKGVAGIYEDGVGASVQAPGYADSGSAARFFASFPQAEARRFYYTSKADGDDRLGSRHPTVKPVDLMQWLVKLVCPKGATVLDMFAGTGTTGAAAFIEGRRCVLIEREAEYLADIEKRMGMLLSGFEERSWKLAKPEPLEALPLFALPEPAE